MSPKSRKIGSESPHASKIIEEKGREAFFHFSQVPKGSLGEASEPRPLAGHTGQEKKEQERGREPSH